MTLIPNWKKWWKRHSVYVVGLMPAISYAREHIAELKDYLPTEIYSGVMVLLFVAFLIVLNIKQKSVSGGSKDEPGKIE